MLPPPVIAAVPHIAYVADPSDVEFDDRAARELLERMARDAGADGAAERRIAFGDPAAGLLAVADEERAELIVVGSRRQGAWRAMLGGSVSRTVASRASAPVLVVPAGAPRRRR